MASYTLQADGQWATAPARGSSLAPSTYSRYSTYSDDSDAYSAAPPPLSFRMPPLHRAPDHAHPDQYIMDLGPPSRAPKQPVFQQVRSMLRKPPSDRPTPLKYDEFSGNPSENGKAAFMRASTWKSPYQFEVRRRSPVRDSSRNTSQRSLSPVSTLDAADVESPLPAYGHSHGNHSQTRYGSDAPPAPVSPVSAVSPAVEPHRHLPDPGNERSLSVTPAPVPNISIPKRKPVATAVPDDTPPPEPTVDLHADSEPDTDPHFDRQSQSESIDACEIDSRDRSHFSWTTCATSVRQNSVATRSSGLTRFSTRRQSQDDSGPSSRFSWSTVATGMTHQMRPDSPPPSPPPAVPSKYRQPPIQSILSRQRPIPRPDHDLFMPSPPPPPPPRPIHAATFDSTETLTPPTSAQRRAFTYHQNSSSGSKKLPLPPELGTATAPLSHLETLLRQEEDIVHQRRNIERLLREDEKIEKASPIDVSFAALRDAKKRLDDRKLMLAEIQLEERQIGIAISRARRRDGEDDGLWVRRVTG